MDRPDAVDMDHDWITATDWTEGGMNASNHHARVTVIRGTVAIGKMLIRAIRLCLFRGRVTVVIGGTL